MAAQEAKQFQAAFLSCIMRQRPRPPITLIKSRQGSQLQEIVLAVQGKQRDAPQQDVSIISAAAGQGWYRPYAHALQTACKAVVLSSAVPCSD